MDYVRDTLHNRDHPGIKLQALQKPVGYDIYAGPNCISDTKYDVIKKKDCSDDWMNTAKNIVAKMINKDTHLCEEWIRIVTKSATLSSSSISYLQNIWSISQNINSAKTKNRQLFYNLELYKVLITKHGQTMLKQFPLLASTLELEVDYQYSNRKIMEWNNWWNDVFGITLE